MVVREDAHGVVDSVELEECGGVRWLQTGLATEVAVGRTQICLRWSRTEG